MGPDPVPGGENLFCFNFGSGSFLEKISGRRSYQRNIYLL